MNKNDQEWVCIDDIHAFYKRKISDKVYEFKKRSKITKVIDLNKYTYEQQEEALQTMCWDFAFLQELRHSEESINEIVAELLYEKESEFDNTDVTLTIPVEHAEEVIHLIRYALCEQNVSNKVWIMLQNFCDNHSQLKMGNDEEASRYSSKYSNKK